MKDGIILIDKPKGLTSRDVVNIVGKRLNTRKIGHTGTLDPLATGLMVLCVNKATKLVELLTNHDKSYIATVKLGIKTDTYDITGKILEKNDKYKLDINELNKVLNSFIGEYEQEVPIYSAIKVNGKKLYEYARNNEKVLLPKHLVTIKDIKLLDFNDEMFSFYVSVSKGTYIRSLINDISIKIGILMTMSELRRITIDKFNLDKAKNIDEVSYDDVLEISDIVDFPVVVLNDQYLEKKVRNGVDILNTYHNDMVLFQDKMKNNIARRNILINNHNFIETIENENMTSASSYYIAIIAKNKEALEKNKEEFELACSGVIPKLIVEQIKNKKNLIKIFCNMYFSNNNLDQVIYYDFIDLVCPLKISEQISNLKFDDEEIQLLSIKNYPLFIEHGFLDRIINLPNVKASVTINESIEQYKLINILNSSFKAVLADYNSSKNLSDVTEMQTLMNNYKLLIEQISANDEKIKDVSKVLAISGDKKTRDELIKEIKRNAELYQIKVDIPKMRQMEAWQSYDLTDKSIGDYSMYLPTITLASTFFFTEIYHNDTTGYLIGEDSAYGLPVFYDPYFLSKSRTNHNAGIIGTSGSGKSYFLKLLITNEFARGTKLFLFDIENELQKLCNRCGGEYIDLSSKSLINPLQIRNTISNVEEMSVLGKHLGFLESFFKIAFEDISEKELVVLIDVVEKFYNSRGINKKTSIEEIEKMEAKDFPIFSDLYAYLLEQQRKCENKELLKILTNIEVLLKRMVVGQDSNLFNGITTINLSNDLVVFNLQELLFNSSKRLINTQMINLLTFLSNEIVNNKKKNEMFNRNQKMLIVLDEFHNYIDEDSPTLLKYFDQLNRRSRKYKTGIIVASQQPADFTTRTSILRHASAIFNNCQYQLTGMLKDADVEAVEKLYSNTPLTETQKTFLSRCNQGQFLLNITNRNRLRVNIFATPVQAYYMGEIDECPIIDNL